MGDAINREAVIAANPSVVLKASAINAGTISQSDMLAESLGAPVVMLSDTLEETPAATALSVGYLDLTSGRRLLRYMPKLH